MSEPEAPAGSDTNVPGTVDDAAWDHLEFEANWQQAASGNDDDNNFTDFAQAVGNDLPEDDGFADFAAFESATKEEEEDESWTAFEATTEVTQGGHHSSSQQEQSSEHLLRMAFPGGEPEDSMDTLDPSNLQTKLWQTLQDLDQAASLLYQWSNSSCCQHLLHSLNIDSRNIECIPPAQFDWTSSGLVNPLEQPSSSSLLDLDFLTALSSSTRTDAPAGSVTNGLEEELACPSDGAPSVRGACRLQQLLASNVPTLAPSLQPRSKPPLLSSDAQRLLDSLPDLAFMQAAVLMFPVRLDS